MTYKRKLIEVALPLDAINEAAIGEKARKRGKPTQMHHWWAPRPLVAARAVLWSSLVDDPSAHPDQFPTRADQDLERQRLFDILRELVKWENSNNTDVLERARSEVLSSCGGELPNVLDPFCGGGAIPLESQRLGLPTFGGDLNPVSVMISKGMVEIPPRFSGLAPINPDGRANVGLTTWEGTQGLAEDLRYYAGWWRDRVFQQVGHLYPKVEIPRELGGGEATAIAWIWARTIESPDPAWDGHVPLVRGWVLRKAKRNKPVVWVQPVVDRDSQTIEYRIKTGGTPIEPTRVSRRGDFQCIATGTPIPNRLIRERGMSGSIGKVPIAVVAEGERGRLYVPAGGVENPSSQYSLEGTLPPGSRYMAPPLYGFDRWEKMYTPRQLAALTTFSDLLEDVRLRVIADSNNVDFPDDVRRLNEGGTGSEAYADAIVTYLAFMLDRVADWNNSFCAWEKNAEVPQQTMGRQAIAMIWDFAEANPFSNSTGSMNATIKTISSSVEELPVVEEGGSIEQMDAVARIKGVVSPLVSTDPPYYDNISYSDLSDFFYVWLRRSLRNIWPEELSTVATPKTEELIAHAGRAGSREKAKNAFESGMREVFDAIASNQDERFPATIFYAFKQEETDRAGTASTGWETFIEGLVRSGMAITGTWPIRTEMASRRVAHGAAALASSIVIACRPRSVDASRVSAAEFVAALRGELPDAIRLLQKESIAPVDMAQSAIGPGMAVFSRYSEVVEADGKPMSVRRALVLINEVLQEVLSEEETEFDGDTRWALTWFEQNGLNPADFGDADVLARAKNTSVKGVVDSAIAVQREGKVRLKGRDELVAGWDPADDPRPTVWEATQHLITALGESESQAADLLRRLGSERAERARQLSYLLYQVADRKGWAEEAVAYNGLVQAWIEISRLAGQSQTPVQQTLGE